MKLVPVVLIVILVASFAPVLLAQTSVAASEEATLIYEAPSGAAPLVDVPPPPTPLSSSVADAYRDGSNIVALTGVTLDEVEAVDREWSAGWQPPNAPPPRIGIVRLLEGARADSSIARENPLADGRSLWTLAVRSPEACRVRLHITDFDVGDGEALIFGSGDNGLVAYGPFKRLGPNGTGEFWTATLPGDTAYIEIASKARPSIRIDRIVHVDRPFGMDPDPRARCTPTNPALGCHLDALCQSVDGAAREATGQMNFVVGMACGVCTGTLLNDLDPETAMPYFLTANHCFGTQAQASSLEVAFGYQTAFCGDPNAPNWTSSSRIVGSTLLATSDLAGGSDMTFLRLSGLPPNALLSGWTTATSAGAYGVHHPGGWWKRAYFVSPVGTCPGCEFCPGDSDEFDYYDITNGIEEGGSSGSGIFTSGGLLCGQLWGHCCLYPSCAGDQLNCGNSGEFVVTYGEFQSAHPLIRQWLEIGGTINVNRAYVGPEMGTPTQPFNTFVEGYNFAWSGSRVRLAANNYPEPGTYNKPIEILASGGTVVIGQ